MRISDRVFGHALRRATAFIPRSPAVLSRSYATDEIREMITSSTLATIVVCLSFLFMVVAAIIAPPLAWIAPVAALLMILPGVALQKTGCPRQRAAHEATLRNAVLVESVQGLERY